MIDWPSPGSAVSAGTLFATFYILYCMLIARSPGKASQRLATTPVIPSRGGRLPYTPSTAAFAAQQQRALHTRLPTSPLTMLKNAARKHEQESARASSLQNFFSSSPPAPTEHKPTNSSVVNPGYRNPLKPAAASALNGVRSYQSKLNGVSSGTKRTSSGLAKVTDGSFDEGPGSQQDPIVLDGKKNGGQTTLSQADFFDENEFDSDIELDVEQPKTLPSYPKLPQQAAKKPSVSPVAYPTLPRQQQAQVGPNRDAGAGMPQSKGAEPPGSSLPLDWSSSPPEHLEAAQPSFKRFAYNPSSIAPPRPNQPVAAKPVAKKRQLPWLTQEAEKHEEIIEQPPPPKAAVSKKPAPASTPGPKSMYPWNTTASAVKEQQKKHREEARKAIKVNEGTEDDVRKAKTARSRPARVFLSEEQQHVLDLVTEKKKSVFFTGSAGTGKSVLMRECISSLRMKYQREPDRVAVTASTGLAACNIGGVTLHSFAGIGLGKEDVPELVRKIKKNQKAKHRWMRTKVLVVDEVSMVDGELFDKLEAIARQLRNNGRPFGGIQLVITGDFFQLPPVPDSGRVAKFAFDAGTWNTTIDYTIGLHHVFRQKDPIFAGMLNEMREGRLSESSIKAFRNLSRQLTYEDSIEATELFPTRSEVDRANTTRLAQLQGSETIFEARDGGTIVDKGHRDKLLTNCMAPEMIKLKKGAQVMLIKNIDETLVNGSLGKILGFMSESDFDRYEQSDTAAGELLPSQTTDMGAALEDKAKARSLQGITTSRRYPVVRFKIADGTSRDLLCQPETWKVELPNGEVQASRGQIPLILAWALSIHKAQGQTLDRVKVDLGKVFEKGQAYVALSRATSMAGLQVLRFDPKKVNAHERVRTFYSNLSRVELAEKYDKDQGKKKSAPAGFAAGDYEKRFTEG